MQSSSLANWQTRLRQVLAAILLITVLVTTCFAGPAGIYLGLVAALASLIFCFDREMLVRALMDWGVRCFVASFFILWIAFIASAQRGEDMLAFVDFLAFLVVIPAYALLARQTKPGNPALVAGLAGIGCAAALATGIYEVHILGIDRAQGSTSAIFFSDMSVLLGFFALWGLVTVEKWWRWLSVPAFAFAMGAAVLGGTRGSMLAAVAVSMAFAFYVLFIWRQPLAQRILTLAVVSVVTLAFLFTFFDMSRMLSIAKTAGELADFGVSQDLSANLRMMFYNAALQSFADAPFFGHGWWRRFAAAIPYMPLAGVDDLTHANYAHLHNDTLNFASAAGVTGIVAYIILMAAPIVGALCSPRTERWSLRVCAAVGLSLGYIAMGLTDTMFVFENPRTMYCLSAAIVLAFFLDAPPLRKAS